MNDRLTASSRASWPVALVIALLACAAIIVGLQSLHAKDDPAPVAADADVALGKLPASTTAARIPRAPRDREQGLAPSGTVVHPRTLSALYRGPNGKAFAKIAPQQFGETWLPVVARAGRWLQVLLPSRPDGSTGWIQAAKVDQAHSSYQVQVHLDSRRLDLFDGDQQVGSWTVAIGAPGTPTPTGRTFLLGQLVDDAQSFSPVILPLGTHSQSLDTYGGGPGTVAIHGWTDPSVFGQAVSHGCIRVPADALARLREVPLGTAVLITKT